MAIRLPRKSRITATNIVLALLLFGHFAVMAQACVMPKAASMMMLPAGDEALPPCCKEMTANACLIQLSEADEVLSAMPISMLPAALPARIILSSVQSSSRPRPLPRAPAAFGEPPQEIRYCSFQT